MLQQKRKSLEKHHSNKIEQTMRLYNGRTLSPLLALNAAVG